MSIQGISSARTVLLIVAIAGALSPSAGQADALHTSERAVTPYATRGSVMAGVNQWVVFGGGNLAAQVKYRRLVFEYSHGQALQFNRVSSIALTEEERDEGVSVEMPWTTGGGVGFQITPHLHVLLEMKAHRYKVTAADANDSVSYTSITVGPGVFYDLYLYRGLFVQPSVRWWPTVASTKSEDAMLRRTDGTMYAPDRHDLAPFVNINVGYTFGK